VQSGDTTTFQRNILPPSSGSKIKGCQKLPKLLLLVSYLAYFKTLKMGRKIWIKGINKGKPTEIITHFFISLTKPFECRNVFAIASFVF
jgi:hypothetical protein